MTIDSHKLRQSDVICFPWCQGPDDSPLTLVKDTPTGVESYLVQNIVFFQKASPRSFSGVFTPVSRLFSTPKSLNF